MKALTSFNLRSFIAIAARAETGSHTDALGPALAEQYLTQVMLESDCTTGILRTNRQQARFYYIIHTSQ